MHRTQIYFPKSLHEDLKIAAAATNLSLSEYIRMNLEEKLYHKPAKKTRLKRKRADLTIIANNAINFGIKDLARNFDKYFEESLK